MKVLQRDKSPLYASSGARGLKRGKGRRTAWLSQRKSCERTVLQALSHKNLNTRFDMYLNIYS